MLIKVRVSYHLESCKGTIRWLEICCVCSRLIVFCFCELCYVLLEALQLTKIDALIAIKRGKAEK